MRVLILSGQGPYFKHSQYLAGTLCDPSAISSLQSTHYTDAGNNFGLDKLCFRRNGGTYPLLRRRGPNSIPHLTSFTLDSIAHNAGLDYELFPLENVWAGNSEPREKPQLIFLSTTFICDRQTLRRALIWINDRFSDVTVALGGQYSNLKYAEVLREYPQVTYVVRGDGEIALPQLARAVSGEESLDGVPNLVSRNPAGDGLIAADISYIDLEHYPSPSFPSHHSVVPYESMRGCPFRCKFCSFPFASPEWRYKSAEKICRDWTGYRELNGTSHIKAMDSTFTVPPSRLRLLLPLLPSAGVTWEAYTRANVLNDTSIIDQLARARCKELSIGFESMSERVLGYMNKKVSAAQNRRAFELLRNSGIAYRCSFMAGYPGENPDDYAITHDFLVNDYAGHFMLSVFSLIDETMPVWEDSERFEIRIFDPDNPDYAWSHVGMDVQAARTLQKNTLDAVRSRNDSAVPLLWQVDYELPLLPHLDWKQNLQIEKLVDRLIMVPRDHSRREAEPALKSIFHALEKWGIEVME